MDSVAQLNARDRRALFEVAGASLPEPLLPQVIEKDFWVTWTLKRLFSITEFPGLLFKGGTSLSKAFHVIERFSEDVDLTLDREFFSFPEETTLEALSGKKRDRSLDEMSETFKKFMRGRFTKSLDEAIRSALPGEEWGLDPVCPEVGEPYVLFEYPRSLDAATYGSAYLKPAVKLEPGVRGALSPASNETIRALAAVALSDQFTDPLVQVRTLAAERTFWEKVLILHDAQRKNDGEPARFRHCYDLARMAGTPIGERALESPELFRAVVRNARTFFRRSRQASVELDTVKLVPIESSLARLRTDYREMEIFFFGKPPNFESVIEALRVLEEKINVLAAPSA